MALVEQAYDSFKPYEYQAHKQQPEESCMCFKQSLAKSPQPTAPVIKGGKTKNKKTKSKEQKTKSKIQRTLNSFQPGGPEYYLTRSGARRREHEIIRRTGPGWMDLYSFKSNRQAPKDGSILF